ncbi:ABC transporter substrate-binding protein [Paenibacillus sp.]|uniref:ABC transporter substrate-binding protein n=1 Tax=Paenibacillus sp. TaxID=58172 RepID=UPI002D6DF09B|nr:ABC transporter substrate-binding protein [Paenibacillus sp.]HZG84037.1 ABC transporter substrate-binding protein [Paenibacillus sp.]
MKKRVKTTAVTIILALIMTVFLFACGDNQSSSSSESNQPSKESKTEPPVELVMTVSLVGNPPADLQLVTDEINKYLIEKINAKIKVVPISFGSYSQQINLMLTGKEQLDLMVTGPQIGFTSQVGKNQLLPLNEYLNDHGQGILEVVDKEIMKVGMVKGEPYAVPVIGNSVQGRGFVLRKEIADKYNVDMTKIKTLDDVEAVLKVIKENEPDVVPLVPDKPGESILSYYETGDTLGDSIGYLPNFDNDLKVVNLYETQEYSDLLNRMKRWYDAGYLLQDGSTNKEDARSLLGAKRAAAYFGTISARSDEAFSKIEFGTDVVRSMILRPALQTSTAARLLWAIPRNSQHPEKAMEVLNLLYTDETFVNLIDYGLEGKHYVKLEDGRIDYPQGVDRNNSPYPGNWNFLFGNMYLAYVKLPNEVEFHEINKASHENAIRSKALGFNFDPNPVRTQYAAVRSVLDKYKLGLETGMLDPAKVLPEFIAQLKVAGIDEVIAEKQKQLDEWAATNK